MLGPEIARSLASIDFEKNGVSVSGFLAPPDIQRTNSQSLFLYVNGRAVWDRLLQRAVLTAYEALIPRGKFPVAALFVGISPALVDVNVHPAKREIRFRNPGEVISILRDALFEAPFGDSPEVIRICAAGRRIFRKKAGGPLCAGWHAKARRLSVPQAGLRIQECRAQRGKYLDTRLSGIAHRPDSSSVLPEKPARTPPSAAKLRRCGGHLPSPALILSGSLQTRSSFLKPRTALFS